MSMDRELVEETLRSVRGAKVAATALWQSEKQPIYFHWMCSLMYMETEARELLDR